MSAGRGPVRVLVSGFGPFPGVPVNPTADLAHWLAADGSRTATGQPSAVQVTCVLLPTSWDEAARRWSRAIRDHAPDVAVSFGVSRRASGFVVECLARNAAHGPDVDGVDPHRAALADEGPRFLRARMPGRALVRALRAAGLPATRSLHAGRYLCNAVLYRGLSHAPPDRRPPLIGFVHVPAVIVDGAFRPHRHALTWDEAQRGATTILRCLAARAGR